MDEHVQDECGTLWGGRRQGSGGRLPTTTPWPSGRNEGGIVTPCHLEATGGRVSDEEQGSQIQSAWLYVGTQSADGKYGPMCKITEQLGIIY